MPVKTLKLYFLGKSNKKQQTICAIQVICCLFLCVVIDLFAAVLAASIVKHCLLFDDMPLRYIIKKDIKFFGVTFLSRKVTKP